MITTLEPLVFKASGASVAIGQQPQISFLTERHLVVLTLSRREMERLHHEIGAKLKAAPVPARKRKVSTASKIHSK